MTKEGDHKKALEQEIAKEMHTQDALQKMLASPGSEKTKQIARQQLTESVAKVEKLKNEMANPTTYVAQDVSGGFRLFSFLFFLFFLSAFSAFSAFSHVILVFS